jgi:hypothetical protein
VASLAPDQPGLALEVLECALDQRRREVVLAARLIDEVVCGDDVAHAPWGDHLAEDGDRRDAQVAREIVDGLVEVVLEQPPDATLLEQG